MNGPLDSKCGSGVSPGVSVVLPVHNGMPFLAEAVESLLGQTFRDFELLAIDDGSTDDTPRYLRSLDDSRVRYHRLEHTGLVGAENYGLSVARGSLVARMDADDVAYPQRLERQHGLFVDQPRCVLSSCQFDYIDEAGKVTGQGRNGLQDRAIRWCMLFGTAFVHPGAMYRREVALTVGGYRPECEPADDYDLWTRMAPHGLLTNHPETLLKYRIHDKSMSTVRAQEQVRKAAAIAGRYAASLGLAAAAFQDLDLLLNAGEVPAEHRLGELTRAFDLARRFFRNSEAERCEELESTIQTVQQRLRWRCLHVVEEQPWRVGRAWRWLRAAARFDPEHGTIGSMLGRKLAAITGRGA